MLRSLPLQQHYDLIRVNPDAVRDQVWPHQFQPVTRQH
jgi:hypothetical protein